jgi:hypothetical protein
MGRTLNLVFCNFGLIFSFKKLRTALYGGLANLFSGLKSFIVLTPVALAHST